VAEIPIIAVGDIAVALGQNNGQAIPVQQLLAPMRRAVPVAAGNDPMVMHPPLLDPFNIEQPQEFEGNVGPVQVAQNHAWVPPNPLLGNNQLPQPQPQWGPPRPRVIRQPQPPVQPQPPAPRQEQKVNIANDAYALAMARGGHGNFALNGFASMYILRDFINVSENLRAKVKSRHPDNKFRHGDMLSEANIRLGLLTHRLCILLYTSFFRETIRKSVFRSS